MGARHLNLNRFFERLPAHLHEPFVEGVPLWPCSSAASAMWRRTSTPFKRILFS